MNPPSDTTRTCPECHSRVYGGRAVHCDNVFHVPEALKTLADFVRPTPQDQQPEPPKKIERLEDVRFVQTSNSQEYLPSSQDIINKVNELIDRLNGER